MNAKKFRKFMAMLLAATTLLSSVPMNSIAAESETVVSTETETETQQSTETPVTLTVPETVPTETDPPATESTEEVKETQAATEAQDSSESTESTEETKGTESTTETPESTTGETGSTDESDVTTETDDTESTESESETPAATETEETEETDESDTTDSSEVTETTETTSEETTEATESEETETETEETETETEEESKVTTGDLKIYVGKGGKVILKDKDNNLIKEVAYVEGSTDPSYVLTQEEGTVVNIEIVPDGEGYEVGTYRLTTDTGKVLEDVAAEDGTVELKKSFMFEAEAIRSLEVSFDEVEVEKEDVLTVSIDGTYGSATVVDGDDKETIYGGQSISVSEDAVITSNVSNGQTFIGTCTDGAMNYDWKWYNSSTTEFTAKELLERSDEIVYALNPNEILGVSLMAAGDDAPSWVTKPEVNGVWHKMGSWTLHSNSTNPSTSYAGGYFTSYGNLKSTMDGLDYVVNGSTWCLCHDGVSCGGGHPQGGAQSPVGTSITDAASIKITSITKVTSGEYKGYKRVNFSIKWGNAVMHQNGTRQYIGGTGYYYIPDNPSIEIPKRIANKDFASQVPSRYKLNTRFTVYSDAACTKEVKSVRVKSDDLSSETVTIMLDEPGTYWVKETGRATGCATNTTVYGPYKLKKGETAKVVDDGANSVANYPMRFRGQFIYKHDEANKPLPGAVFRVRYSARSKESADYKVERTWWFQTDANGVIEYDEDHLLKKFTNNSGTERTSDELYVLSNGSPALPIGYIYVTEVKAPEGYEILDGSEKEIKLEAQTDINDAYTTNLAAVGATDWQNVSEGGYLNLTKLDGSTLSVTPAPGYNMQGAKYTVYNSAGTAVTTLTIPATGSVQVKLPVGTYTVRETTPPAGYTADSKTYSFTITNEQVASVSSTDMPIPQPFYIRKVSGNPNITNNNAMYPLSNAVFHVFKDASCTTRAEDVNGNEVVLTTGADGVSNTVQLLKGTYYVKEITAPSGYHLNTEAVPVVLDAPGVTKEVQFTDQPMWGTIDLGIHKVADGTSNRPLAGAQFRIEYFDNLSCSGTPERTWVIQTDERGYTYLRQNYLVSGDALYGNDTLPLGSVRVTEIKAPEGFEINTDVRTGTIQQQGNTVSVNLGNIDTVPEDFKYGGIKIQKLDGDKKENESSGDASLAGAVFEIINANDFTVHTADNKNTAIQPGGVVCEITTDENGVAQTPRYYDRVSGESSEYLMAAAKYIVREKMPSTGYNKLDDFSITVAIPDDKNPVVDTTISEDSHFVEPLIHGGFKLGKEDLETGYEPQGDATLEGAKFELVNNSAKSVLVDVDGNGTLDADEEFANGAVITTLVTDENGIIETPSNFLPYGTYTITEKEPPVGYTPYGERLSRTFSIREDGVVLDFTGEEDAAANRVIRFDVTIIKFKDTPSTVEDAGDDLIPLEGCEFEIRLKRTNELVTTIVTNEDGVATTVDPDNYPYGRLPYGTYVVTETKHPADVMPIEPFEITGTVDGKNYQGIYKNDIPVETPLTLIKVDAETGKIIPLAGTTIQILDSNKEVITFVNNYPHREEITDFVTDASGSITLPEKLPYGTYYVHEVMAPEGYLNDCLLGEDIQFTVDTWGSWEKPIEIRVADTPAKGHVIITKTDADTGDVIEGAVFNIFASEDIITAEGTVRYTEGQLVDTITTNAEGKAESKDLYLGKYHVQEAKAPEGYCLNTNTFDFELVYKDQLTELVYDYVDVTDKPTTMKLYKKDIDDLELEGITFELERIGDVASSGVANEKAIEGGTFVTDENGLITAKYIKSGLYSVTETATLPGYVLDETPRYIYVDSNGFIFECDVNGNNLDEDGAKSDTETLTWVNDYTKWDFTKVDATGDNEVPGAEMEIYNEDDELVYSWTSTEEPHRIVKIPIGKYTLVEKTAPEGYVRATEVPFEVTNTGVVQTCEMVDITYTVNKVDQDGNPVEGAEMAVFHARDIVELYNNKPVDPETDVPEAVDAWTSGTEGHRVSNLVAGETYVLVEDIAPEGWVKANPLIFTVEDNGKDQEITMVDIRVKANKFDTTLQNYVPGAKLEVTDIEGTVVDQWVTDGEAHYVSGLQAGMSYTLTEVETPEGYVTASPVNFTVMDEGKDIEVTMVDKQVFVTKVDTEVKELAGAELEVRDKDNNVVDSWVSDGTPHAIKGLVVGETYTLIETKAPEGYAIALPIEFTVEDNATNDEFDLINKQVFVSKVDVTGENEIPGAKLQVTDLDGNVMDEWTSTTEPHPISNIKVGETYILHEEVAAEGYVIASDIQFTVDDDDKDQTVTMTDKQVLVSKKTITGEGELPGATLSVYDKDGKVVDTWVSTTEAHAVSGLKVNETYTLREEIAAEGYVIASDITFTVADDFQIQKVEMIDKQVFVTKKAVTGEEELPGAKLKVTDKDGNVVDEWTSTTEQHPVSGLRVGETYTLYEEVAPEGYVIASSIQFTVEDDFKVQVVEMKDKQVFVSKKSITGDEELPGAELTVTEKESGEVVDKWTSTTEQHPVSGLEVNKTYVLKEVLAPEGYVIANEIEFTVADDMTVQLVEMKDKQVSVSKKDVTTEEELPGAELTVTDKETGKVVDSWTSTEEEHFVNGLEVEKTYILTEVTAPDGYVKAESIEFTVADDLTVQHVEMKDKQVGISKVDITTQEELPGAELSVYDKETGDVVDEWVSTEEEHFVSGLEVGKTYILTETTAPDGYVTAEDIEFTVEDDFTVQHVTMEDDYTKVEISKTDITTGKELPGAKLEITDEEGNVVEEWTSTNEPHMIERLPVGDYVLTEITAPAGYEVAESVEFTVEETGEIQHVLMEDSPTPQTPGIPQTGENMRWFIGGGIVVVLAAISLVLLKLRKKETDK